MEFCENQNLTGTATFIKREAHFGVSHTIDMVILVRRSNNSFN